MAAIGASFLMAASVLLLREWHVILRIAIGGLVYLACLYLFGGISKNLIKDLISAKKQPAEELGPAKW